MKRGTSFDLWWPWPWWLRRPATGRLPLHTRCRCMVQFPAVTCCWYLVPSLPCQFTLKSITCTVCWWETTVPVPGTRLYPRTELSGCWCQLSCIPALVRRWRFEPTAHIATTTGTTGSNDLRRHWCVPGIGKHTATHQPSHIQCRTWESLHHKQHAKGWQEQDYESGNHILVYNCYIMTIISLPASHTTSSTDKSPVPTKHEDGHIQISI